MKNERELQETLRACSLHTLIVLTSKILTRTGFGDIVTLDRRHRLQKSKLGGCELLCQTNIGTVPIKVIVKIIKDSVRTRMLDELAGAIDRTEADFGIIVSSENLGRKERETQQKYRKSKVEIIDGKLLSEMLMKFRIGVRPNTDVDFAFFAELESQLDHVFEFINEKARVAR